MQQQYRASIAGSTVDTHADSLGCADGTGMASMHNAHMQHTIPANTCTRLQTLRAHTQDPDEFWVQDLVGCNVILQSSGHGLGVVVDVISGTGTYDTIVVQLNLTAEDITNSSTR